VKAPVAAATPAIVPQANVPAAVEAVKPPAADAGKPVESKSVVAVLPAPDQGSRDIQVLPAPPGEQRVITRNLQSELRRVGCDPGAVDGTWSEKSREALGLFNQHAGTKLDTEAATVAALDAVKVQRGRICPLTCGAGQEERGGRCVAIPSKPQVKKEAVRPEPSARDRARERAEKARDRARVRAKEENVSRRPAASRAACPAGSSPFNTGGRWCCEVTPDGRGAPRVFCP
jgi:hypothetical protein